MTENMARTISPILGAALADRFHRFKLIGIFGYVFGKIIRKKINKFGNYLGILSTGFFIYSITLETFAITISTAAMFGFATSFPLTVLFNYIGEISFPNSESLAVTLTVTVYNLFTFVISELIR